MSKDIRLSRQQRAQLMAEVGMAIREAGAASDVFDEAVAARLGINRTDLLCLDLIEREQPMTAGDVARKSGLTTGAVTAVLDRLERRQLVRRTRDASDRRKVLVELVPEAAQVVLELYAPLGKNTETALRSLSDGELKRMRDFFVEGRDFTLREADRVRNAT
jgi:DNA-binding MarR family transcriptional regulator